MRFGPTSPSIEPILRCVGPGGGGLQPRSLWQCSLCCLRWLALVRSSSSGMRRSAHRRREFRTGHKRALAAGKSSNTRNWPSALESRDAWSTPRPSQGQARLISSCLEASTCSWWSFLPVPAIQDGDRASPRWARCCGQETGSARCRRCGFAERDLAIGGGCPDGQLRGPLSLDLSAGQGHIRPRGAGERPSGPRRRPHLRNDRAVNRLRRSLLGACARPGHAWTLAGAADHLLLGALLRCEREYLRVQQATRSDRFAVCRLRVSFGCLSTLGAPDPLMTNWSPALSRLRRTPALGLTTSPLKRQDPR